MADKKRSSLSSRLQLQRAKKGEDAILQEEGEKKYSWSQIFIFVLLLYAGMSFMHGCFSIIDLKAQENAVVAQTQEAETTQKQLENEVSYMQTQEAVEKTAREDLKMVKPGEILLAQRENTDADSKEDAQTSDETTSDKKTSTTDKNTASGD